MKERALLRLLKPFLAKFLYQEGAIRTILWGPCRGLRYEVFPNGLAPLYGGWESHAQRLMVENIRPGSTVYDIGANYGIHPLLMARLVSKHGHVYAFEPVPEILFHLKKNLLLNGFSNTTCLELAVADWTGNESFLKGHHGGAGHLETSLDVVGQRLTVDTVTLDEFVFKGNHRPPNFIKIDVEGAERKVLSGGEKVLQTFRPILLVDLHTPEQDVAVGQALLKFRYDAYRTENGSKVSDLSKGWPDPMGLWGQFIGIPST